MGREGRKTAEKGLSLEVNGRKLYKIIKTTIESQMKSEVLLITNDC